VYKPYIAYPIYIQEVKKKKKCDMVAVVAAASGDMDME
jgi:hypothetical protein